MKLACVHMCACAHNQKTFLTKKIFFDQNFFSPKPPKKIFHQKNFFYTNIFFTKKNKKNINCAETLISPKHQPRRRATFPEGP